MSAHASPLVGFNNNVVHRGRVFHIQTEDSGVKRPHLITHLFADGGRIVKSQRTDYTEYLDRPDRAQLLRKLMKEQHKAMFVALRDGSLDSIISDIFGEQATAGQSDTVALAGDAPAQIAEQELRARRSSAPVSARSRSKRPGKPRSQRPSKRPKRSSHPSGVVDVALVQRAPKLPSDRFAVGVAPAKAEKPLHAGSVSSATESKAAGAKVDTPLMGSRGDGKYAGARPAHIFDPPGAGASLFGARPPTEQCLDDAILGYLSEGAEDFGDD